MKIKSILKLALVLTGIYHAFNMLYYFGSSISFIIQGPEEALWNGVIVNLVYTIAISYFLIFQPAAVINLFKLEQRFLDDELNIEATSIHVLIKMVIILIGLWLIASQLSPFVVHLVSIILTNNSTQAQYNLSADYQDLYTAMGSVIIGIILLIYHPNIANFIQNKGNSDLDN